MFFHEKVLYLSVLKQRREGVAQRCSVNKVLTVLQNSQESICARVSFSIKLQAKANNFIKKETLIKMFSFEFCEIFKNIFSYRTHPAAVSERDWFYQSSFWRLCVPNLNMDDKRNIGFGKKEMLFIKEFLNFHAGWRIICLKPVKLFKKLQLNIFKWSAVRWSSIIM